MTTRHQVTNIQPAEGKKARLVVWKMTGHGYMWELRAGNSWMIARGRSAYRREANAYKAALRAIALLRGNVVIERQTMPGGDWVQVLVPGM